MSNQLHLVANAAKDSGGEGLAALRYTEFIARAGCVATLLAKRIPADFTPTPLEASSFDLINAPARQNLVLELFAQYRFMQRLCEQRQIDLIHLHGMWSPFLVVGALVARKRNVPYIISPHGTLEPWTLRHKQHKKWLALKTYQGTILRSASLFVATAEQELDSIKRLGLRQPVAIIPNGVDIGAEPRRKVSKQLKTILFLSRLHPIKGLMDLVEAWAIVRRAGWQVVIAGGDEEGYRNKVESLIRANGLETDVKLVGFVEGARKQACFDMADIFVLPTYSENFGIVVAEALANELPVITTTGAPWHDLVTYHCGWWVTPGVRHISAALVEAMECSPEILRQMGINGRQLVIEKYSWTKIGVRALKVSEWLLDPSRQPPEVIKTNAQ